MACPQEYANTIAFTITGTSVATVIVRFEGTKRKQVDLKWGNGDEYVWLSCESEPGVNYPERFENLTADSYEASVKVWYDGLECEAEAVEMLPADNVNQLVLNCNSFGNNPVVAGAWLFQAPGGGDTVQVTLVVEDTLWGEG